MRPDPGGNVLSAARLAADRYEHRYFCVCSRLYPAVPYLRGPDGCCSAARWDGQPRRTILHGPDQELRGRWKLHPYG